MHYVDLPYLRISISGGDSGCGTGRAAVESTRHSAVLRNERIVAFHRPDNVANGRENVARREGRNMLMFKSYHVALFRQDGGGLIEMCLPTAAPAPLSASQANQPDIHPLRHPGYPS
jgi:hypothetical protein